MKKKIALVTMAKDEDFYLQEWIDYHLKLGFDDIYIFQNNWRFKNKINHNQVHFMEWDVDSTIPIEGQATWEWNRHSKCYSKFGKDYHSKYEWAAFIDVDCFLVLKQTDDVKTFIADYDNISQPQLVINFAFFGDNGHETFNENNTSVLERFTKRWDKPYTDSYYQFLPICKLHENFCCHSIHFVNGEWIDVDGYVGTGRAKSDRPISFDKAQLNHYYTKTFPEWLMKLDKTRAEGDWMKNPYEAFFTHNFNDVEDLYALNFYKNK
jgi:hypothetical protein